jgi:hypothetical protein
MLVRYFLCFVTAFFFGVLPTNLEASPLNILDSLVGKWKVTTVRTVGKTKVTYKGTDDFRKLRDGSFKNNASGKMSGYIIRQENWWYPNGTLKGHSYVNGQLNEINSGTWRAKGKSIYVSRTTRSMGLSITSSGTYVVHNRNRVTGNFNIPLLRAKDIATFTRSGR